MKFQEEFLRVGNVTAKLMVFRFVKFLYLAISTIFLLVILVLAVQLCHDEYVMSFSWKQNIQLDLKRMNIKRQVAAGQDTPVDALQVSQFNPTAYLNAMAAQDYKTLHARDGELWFGQEIGIIFLMFVGVFLVFQLLIMIAYWIISGSFEFPTSLLPPFLCGRDIGRILIRRDIE